MDSIGDNVMTIICVVVGILIIGCALIPIVDNASTVETEVGVDEDFSGYNTLAASTTNAWIGKVSSIVIVADGTSISINGSTYEGAFPVDVRSSITGQGRLAYADPSNNTITVYRALDSSLESNTVRLSSGTISYNGSTLDVSGTIYGTSDTYSYSADYSTLYAKAPTECFAEDETEWYGLVASPVIIGEGQRCLSSDEQTVIETTTTETPAGMTMTSNTNHTATLSFSSGNWYGPYKWTGYTTTETITSESEYAGLYNMIPVLCILGMAYVLIRRFY